MGVSHFKHIWIAFAVIFGGGCSSTSWVVQEDAMDPNDFKKIDTRYFLESTNEVSPNQPVVHFELKSINTYEFSTRIKTERLIQRYRPRLSYMLLGMAGAGLSYYAALSEDLVQRPTIEQQYALMGAGTVLTGLSFLNMKPIGEPTRTGETRLLRKTGSVTEVDTLNATPYNNTKPTLRIFYDDNLIVNESVWEFDRDKVSINIAEEVNANLFSQDDSKPIVVEVAYDSLYALRAIPVSSVYEQFVVVESQITALRNAPNTDPDNVLTDLALGSQLKLVSAQDEDWYKVQYGISETFLAAKDVNLIWRPSEFASDLSVFAIPNVPFGSVDVEQDIPVIGQSDLNSSAFIIANDKHGGSLPNRIYGARDAKLMEEYFIQAFGIRPSRIVKALNAESARQIERAYSRLASSLTENQNLTVYLNGYAEVNESQLNLIGSGEDDESRQAINLHQLFKALGNLKLNSLLIFADLDITNSSGDENVLKNLAEIITNENPNAAVIFGSKPNQRSRIYSSPEGEKNRHSIFTYYIADGIKKGNISVNFLFNHLDRNVSFTSRSIYDLPQNPLLYGNRNLRLVN